MNKVVILDFSDGKIKYFNTTKTDIEDLELEICDKGFSLEDIQYMIVNKLEFEYVE